MKTKRLILAALLLSAPAWAADELPAFSISGRAFEDLYLPTKVHTGDTFEQQNTSLWLQGDGKFSSALSARAIYQGDFFGSARLTGDRSGVHLRNRLREGFAEYFQNGLQLRAGKQIIPWGKSDGINPTDFLSAKQSNFLNHDSEVSRAGGVSLLASLTPGSGASPLNFTAVIQPVFPESDYLVPPAALPAGVTLTGTDHPESNAKNTEAAGKVSYAGEGWDSSVSYFHGYDHQPVFAELSHAAVSPTLVTLRAHRIFQRLNAAGADASYSSGALIYRLETAYFWTENNDGLNPMKTPSHWDAVAGLERPLWEKFRLQGQLISRLFPRYTDPQLTTGADPVSAAINREVATTNALLQQYQHRWNTASTLRASYSLTDPNFTAEMLWYQGFNDGDYYLRPMVSYALKEFLNLTLGYDHYGGPTDKSIGSLQSYNAVFTELKATF
ncbi:MAG: hypothetical protein ACXVB9_05735 [Bdellovibrionota bacterium]